MGFSPQQVRTAYGISSIAFGAITGDGSGQTVAIVNAYDHPGFVNSSAANFSSSDLAQFDRQFNLPDPPSFTKLNQFGSATGLPDTDPAGAGNPSGNWEYEEALDVEWAHAIAPKASIILVECNSNSWDDLSVGVATASDLPGVSVVSMSWGSDEFSGEEFHDRNFRTPIGHQGVTFVASTGDSGSPGESPAYSPNVVAVGGTTLTLNSDGSYQGETGWSGSGGGVSSYEQEPAYQQAVQSTGFRTIPDVAFDADPSTGVSIYDSYDNTGNGPWQQIGGTSLAAPAWAALIAIANQGRVSIGGTTLDGVSQTLPALYALPAADFHDITGGSNGGYSAGVGYDEVTGLGTPKADALVPDLASYGLADQLVVSAQPPGSVSAGSPFGLTVEVESPFGALLTGATGTVTIAMANNPGGAALNGTLIANINQGIATFSGLTIDQAGTGYTIQATSGRLSAATTQIVNVWPSAPAWLDVTSEPASGVTAGTTFGLAVSVEDAFGNLATSFEGAVTVSLASGPGGASLGGTLTTVAVNGVATFSGLTLTEAGAGYTLKASSGSFAPATTSAIGVAPATPVQLVITSQPPHSVTAGSSFGLAVSVEDAYGNLETTYGGVVTVGKESGPEGGLSGTAHPARHRRRGQVLRPHARSGRYRLHAPGQRVAVSRARRPRRLQRDPRRAGPGLRSPPSRPRTSRQASGFGVSVTIEDAFGNIETTDNGVVTIALAAGPDGANLGGTLTAPANQGVATFSGLTIDQAGTNFAIQARERWAGGRDHEHLRRDTRRSGPTRDRLPASAERHGRQWVRTERLGRGCIRKPRDHVRQPGHRLPGERAGRDSRRSPFDDCQPGRGEPLGPHSR